MSMYGISSFLKNQTLRTPISPRQSNRENTPKGDTAVGYGGGNKGAENPRGASSVGYAAANAYRVTLSAAAQERLASA